MSIEIFKKMKLFVSGYSVSAHRYREDTTNGLFKCEMTIKKTGETYASSATCDDGNSLVGNGIYNEKTHTIASVFTTREKAEETGVSVTYVKEDGSMTLDWTYLNSTTIGHSVCSRQR